MQILLVEPDTILAGTYVAALEKAGHRVMHAKGSQEAVQAADETLPDLVILEPQLARHNGVELLYEFRSYTEWQHIPCLILTTMPVEVLRRNTALPDVLKVHAVLQKSQTTLADLVQAAEAAVHI